MSVAIHDSQSSITPIDVNQCANSETSNKGLANPDPSNNNEQKLESKRAYSF